MLQPHNKIVGMFINKTRLKVKKNHLPGFHPPAFFVGRGEGFGLMVTMVFI